MSMKNRAPWFLAAGQVLLAGALLYWDHVDYERILGGSGFISLTDHWSMASGILLIIDFPAMVLTLPLLLILPDNEFLVDLSFLSMVFALWSGMGFYFRSNERAATPWRRLTRIAYPTGCLL